MEWTRLISNKRYGMEERDDFRKEYRTQFQRDYDRLIFSAPFRRMQSKTQVFPLPGSVFVHNRLTHSLEVSSVGRSLGTDVGRLLAERHPDTEPGVFGALGSIVSAACLAHDMGNPPFGHSGEKAISSFFLEGAGQKLQHYETPSGDRLTDAQWCDLTHFDGNANAFRLLTHHFAGRRQGGFVMTYSTLASIVKYPYSSVLATKNKFGFFESEKEAYRKIADEMGIICKKAAPDGAICYCRHPLAYLVEAADDICYQIMDIEDAHKLKLISDERTAELLLGFFTPEEQKHLLAGYDSVTDLNERIAYFRACVIGKLEHECVRAFVAHEDEMLRGTFQGTLIECIAPTPAAAYKACSDYAYAHIYRCKDVVDIELAGYRIMYTLLELMTEAVLHPERAYSKLLTDRVSTQYQLHAPTLYGRLMAVVDYVTGMTDVYALDLYRKINGTSLPIV